jgi:transmembrane protein DUF3566
MVTIKRISVSSAMKIGALLNALLFTVFGILFLLLQSLLLNALNTAISQSPSLRGSSPNSLLVAGGLAAFCVFYLVGVVFAAITGGIGGAVGAFFYNLIANWVGGLEVELSANTIEKPKREVMVGGESPTSF